MKLAIIANEQLKNEFLAQPIADYENLCFVKDPQNIPADTYIVFDLLFDYSGERVSLLEQFLPRPVFINAVNETLTKMNPAFIRINGWPTFLSRKLMEVAVLPQQEAVMQQVFTYLGWQYQLVPDITGMISPRITAMIINEAYFTLDKKVSTKEEIDIAMKLGTHYPYGPFEWSSRIGLKRIYELLVLLRKENKLYEISTLLEDEVIMAGDHKK